jgi:hypothetical protein
MGNVSTSYTGNSSNLMALIARASVNEAEILDILKPMIKQYAIEHHDGGDLAPGRTC